jgi:hypothetical protein
MYLGEFECSCASVEGFKGLIVGYCWLWRRKRLCEGKVIVIRR